MTNTIETLKSLAARLLTPAVLRRLSFMPTLTSGGGNFGVSAAGNLSLHSGFTSSGGAFDTELTQGDVLDNSVVAACVNAISQALPEAPILLEKRVGGCQFERVDSHPVLDLLHNPNPYLSEAELWGITTAFERTRGEAFWYFEYEEGGSVPKEIWFRAPQFVQVLSDAEHFISGYNIMAESGKMVSLSEGDVVHFRHQLSASNPRAGWSPIATGRRQIVGDNSAATYHSAILRNAGAASLIISLKDAAAAGEVTPGQLDEYVQQFKRKSSGAGAGAILGMDLPLDVHKVGFSPDEMALDKLLAHYESRICALLGVNRRVINLGQDPTYENSRVALKDFWQRTIIPMRRRHAATLSSQLLPLFGLDPAVYRLSFDFSHVEALREDVDALHARWRATFTAGGIDLYTFQERIGLTPDEAYRGRYAKPSQALDAGEGDEETKSVRSAEWNESDHPRASDGRFGHVAGSPRALPTQKVSGSGASGGSVASGGSSGSSSGSAGVARAKLHQQHGVGRNERKIPHSGVEESGLRKEPKLLMIENDEIVELLHDVVPTLKSQRLSVDEARKQLLDFHDDPEYQGLKQKIVRLTDEIANDEFELTNDFSLLTPAEKAKLQNDIPLKQMDLDISEIGLRNMYAERYPKMWGILCANNKSEPTFKASDFKIKSDDFDTDELKHINTGIDFMSQMLGGRQNPITGDLNFVKGDLPRSAYTDKPYKDWPANTVLVGTSATSARADKMVHEMAHWLAQKNPDLEKQLRWHFERRTEGDPELSLHDVDSRFDKSEKYKRDRFIEPYMGKFYKDGQNEILTVGLQYFVLAPDVLAKRDPETFKFIYKLMRGQNPEIDPAKMRKKYGQAKHTRKKHTR